MGFSRGYNLSGFQNHFENSQTGGYLILFLCYFKNLTVVIQWHFYAGEFDCEVQTHEKQFDFLTNKVVIFKIIQFFHDLGHKS
jgi:hypothetical protein